MSTEAVAAWITVAIAALAALGCFIWWFARLYGKICTIANGFESLKEWLEVISKGNGPVCVQHTTRLNGVDKKLEEHGQRITTLEQCNAIRRKPV